MAKTLFILIENLFISLDFILPAAVDQWGILSRNQSPSAMLSKWFAGAELKEMPSPARFVRSGRLEKKT